MTATDRGTLVLVVGPSGAGKDTLIAGARTELEPTGRYYFPRRIITRMPGGAGEDHIAVDDASFADLKARGLLALSWESHGFRYALPIEIAQQLANGKHVIANVSRGIVSEAESRYAPIAVIFVSAPADELSRRLASRGRESAEEIKERLATPGTIWSGPMIHMSNAGTIEDGVRQMTRLIRACTHQSGDG